MSLGSNTLTSPRILEVYHLLSPWSAAEKVWSSKKKKKKKKKGARIKERGRKFMKFQNQCASSNQKVSSSKP